MTDQYQPMGEGDPRIQLALAILTENLRHNIASFTEHYALDVGVAVVATALGNAVADLNVWINEHAKNCENCEKQNRDYYTLAVKNFGSAYGHTKRGQEARYAALEADATKATDELMARVLKGKHK